MERQDGRETKDVPRPGGEEASGTTETGGSEIPDPVELMARLGIKDNRIRELYEEITAFRLAADEACASKEAGEEHIEALERECANLKERVRDLEEETRGRRRRRESSGRQIARLERELERKEGRSRTVTTCWSAGRSRWRPQISEPRSWARARISHSRTPSDGSTGWSGTWRRGRRRSPI